MSNIIKEALQSKLEQLKLDEKSRLQQVQEFETSVINDWKVKYIDSVPFISNKAKSDLVIVRESGGFSFKCDSERWGSGITVRRNANWRNDEVRPEISWFSSSTDKADKYKYLSSLQILGLLANYMEHDLNPWNDLMNTYDLVSKKHSEIMGDIQSQIWQAESAIRNAEMNQREEEKIKMLNKGKMELPYDADYLPSFYASSDKWSNKRFSHMTWEENKGGKTYKVSGYVINKNWADGKKCHTWFVDRMKKDRLLEAISEGIKKLKEYNEDKATVNA